jgi:DNA polymerase-3 subunit alpha
MQYIEAFCDRKNGRLPVAYKHPDLEEALRETYGIMLYQEQVMKMLSLLAGYTLGEADLVRRAMAKKKADQLALEKERFRERGMARGMSEQLATELFADIEPFAGYAFPKAHGAAYAVLTCQTAYMKANYPTEFMCGLLSAEKENAEKVSEAMAECRHLGIAVLPPDLNSSELDFTIADGKIRFGLSAVKNVGTAAVESIVETRRAGGPFLNLEDLSGRLDWTVAGKRVLESLAKCGALDSFGFERGRLVAGVERIVAVGTQMQRAAAWRTRR